ncbi:uncharacterized protein [Ptychodera flava]|uniref:uncharacterized protein n=1 Tax=Ptychodera flava TaxID=63121 RepID=UPI003969C584
MHGLCKEPVNAMAPNRRDSKEYSSHKIVERRRRHRINSCISELSHVIPSSFMKTKHSGSTGKLEKAEVLELAVAYIHDIQRKASKEDLGKGATKEENNENNISNQNADGTAEIETISKRRFEDGYKACMKEIAQYLAEVEAMAPQDIRFLRLLCHLQNQNFDEVFRREKKSFRPPVKPIRLLARSTTFRMNGSVNGSPGLESVLREASTSDSNSECHSSIPDTPPSEREGRPESPSSMVSPSPPENDMSPPPTVTKHEPRDPTPCEMSSRSRSESVSIGNSVACLPTGRSSVVTSASTPSPAVTMVTTCETDTQMVTKPHCNFTMATSPQGLLGNGAFVGDAHDDGRRRLPPPLIPINVHSSPIAVNGMHTSVNQTVHGNTPSAIAASPPQIVTFLPHPIQNPPATKVITGSKIILDPISGQYFLLPPTQCIQIPTHVHVTPQGANHLVFNAPTVPGHILPPPINHVIAPNGHMVSTPTTVPTNGLLQTMQTQCPNSLVAIAQTPTMTSTKAPQTSPNSTETKSTKDSYLSSQHQSQSLSKLTSSCITSLGPYNSPILPGPPLSPTINPIQALENIAKKDPR